LADNLKNLKKLTFDLTDNIKDEGLIQIARIKTLETLECRYVSVESIKVLSEQAINMKDLTLSFINDAELLALSNACFSLKRFRAPNSSFSKQVIEKFAAKHGPTLQETDLYWEIIPILAEKKAPLTHFGFIHPDHINLLPNFPLESLKEI